MGIGPEDFWKTSTNGKAMIVMLARRENVELVRDVCDWLVGMYKNDIAAANVQNGATVQQAKLAAESAVSGLEGALVGFNDRNCEALAVQIVDAVFNRHFRQSPAQYAKAMSWFADQLRRRVKDTG
jgi:hypothetical protein